MCTWVKLRLPRFYLRGLYFQGKAVLHPLLTARASKFPPLHHEKRCRETIQLEIVDEIRELALTLLASMLCVMRRIIDRWNYWAW